MHFTYLSQCNQQQKSSAFSLHNWNRVVALKGCTYVFFLNMILWIKMHFFVREMHDALKLK